MACSYEWGSPDDYLGEPPDDFGPPEECGGEHSCILSYGHYGEHECACGESQPEEEDY